MLRAAEKLVDLSGNPRGGAWTRPVWRLLEQALGLDQVNQAYAKFGRRGLAAEDFCFQILESLDLDWSIEGEGIRTLAEVKGPCVVMANHPLGGREALLLMVMLSLARRDYRVLANHILGAIPELSSQLILVDPFGRRSSASRNLGPLRQAKEWLQQGGMLGVFPAGEVSFWQSDEGRVADRPWASQPVRLALGAEATIVPVYFSGEQSPWLQGLSGIYPSLKTPFLARELMCAKPQPLRAVVGRPVPCEQWQFWGRPHEVASRLRDRVYHLASKAG